MTQKNIEATRIVLTGGGTAGHVIPHLAVLPLYKKYSWDVLYIGSSGIEKEIIKEHQVPYKTIKAGKLRRYFSFKNLTDIIKVLLGGGQSLMYLMKFRPHVLLSNGGFVSVPVAVAAWLLRIPVVTYEPDQSPGLANRIIMKFARKILYTFPETVKHLPKNKAIYAGTPIRRELFGGSKSRAFQLCGFDAEEKIPQILVMGGSLGALKINQTLLQCLPSLVQNYRVIHITGKGKGISFAHKNYKSFSYLKDELKDIFAISDYIISRAGANAIFEFLALKKPMLLIPLELGSRGDQVLNANSFLQQGWARVLKETDLSAKKLLESLHSLVEDGEQIKKCQSKGPMQDSDQVIFKIMQQYSEARSITEP